MWRESYKFGRRDRMRYRRLYEYWFKVLLNKAMSAVCISGGESVPTVNKDYLKMELMLCGGIALTDKMPRGDGNLYAVAGTLGGVPDECYVPVQYIVANPVLGSAQLYWREFKGHEQDCVLICNTVIDKYALMIGESGLYRLIDQTASLLADNIISINCAQRNCRPVAFVTAQEDTIAAAAEAVMEDIYDGETYKVMRDSVEEAINVSPLANTGVSQTIAQLIELQNYIVSNYLQQLGISANNVRKKERMITDEIKSQDNLTALSITEMLESWQRGFDEVNAKYGTDFAVSLNPAIAQELIEAVLPDDGAGSADAVEPAADNQPEGGTEETDDQSDGGAADTQQVEHEETITEQMQEAAEAVHDIAEHLASGGEEAEDDSEQVQLVDGGRVEKEITS